MKSFTCRCGRPVFFRNSRCLGCGAELGYEPFLGKLEPLSPGKAPETWTVAKSRKAYRRCANLTTAPGCNWLVEVNPKNPASSLCSCCALNRTIPNLDIAGNGERWRMVELAKRRLVGTLIQLRLPTEPWNTVQEGGLAFDLLLPLPGGPPVTTGHENGVITVNLEEADDAHREFVRQAMREQYRTLLGHLRHETGHYYWERLVNGTALLDEFRFVFGDEREPNYGNALAKYYAEGPPPDWPGRFVSAYATAHPWEDWAETWAHYLHMSDSLDTAVGLALRLSGIAIDFDLFTPDVLDGDQSKQAEKFLAMCNDWIRLASVMNELSRSMGHADYYPFVLSANIVKKLYFIDKVIASASKGLKLLRPATQGQETATGSLAALAG
jgi:hypothetical protein